MGWNHQLEKDTEGDGVFWLFFSGWKDDKTRGG